eukprot:COSAG02_NODE_1053_length_14943_cov_3.871076_6_plen_98_part_00
MDAHDLLDQRKCCMCRGILSLAQVIQKYGLKGLDCWSPGRVPWYLMLLLGLWRTRWLIWIDRTLQFAPNPGFGKAVINLNTGEWQGAADQCLALSPR